MKRVGTALLAGAMLMLTACGGSGFDGTIATATTCEELADAAMNLIQDVLDEVGDMSLSDLAEMQDDPPESIQAIEDLEGDLEAKADEIDCSEEEGMRLMCERLDDLDAGEGLGAVFIEGIRSECP